MTSPETEQVAETETEAAAPVEVAPEPAVDRAARMYRFLLERQKRRTNIVRDLRQYARVQWLAGLPAHPAVGNPLGRDELDPDAWLTLDRIEELPHPEPPYDLALWIVDERLDDPEAAEPGLRPIGEDPVPDDVRDRYLDWLPQWHAWATEQRARRQVTGAYRDLYAIYQDSTALAEQYELVLGLGYLTGTSGPHTLRRHLLTIPLAVTMDTRSGRLTVRPADGARLALEEEMLDPVDALPPGPHQEMLSLLAAAEDDPFAPDGAPEALRVWAHAHGPTTTYLDRPVPHRADGDALTVSFAPALVLRERTRRAFVDAFQTLEQRVRALGHVPPALRTLVEPGARVPEPPAAAEEQGEVYFPAPANDEQRLVVERLRRDRVVVVQGPPGTGKTHTIANLVTDLLAHGKRVLVTSHTARALAVLKDKLPTEIQDLCISITADSSRGQDDLKQSVQTVLERLDRYDERHVAREHERLEEQLVAARADRAAAAAKLREIRENETVRYPPSAGGYQGTAAEIAERLYREEATLGWLGPVPDREPALTPAQARRYLDLLRRATPEVRARAGTVPPVEALIPAADFAALAERRVAVEARAAGTETARGGPEYAWLAGLGPRRQQVEELLAAVELLLSRLAARREPWLGGALEEAWYGRHRGWRERHDLTAACLGRAHSYLAAAGGHQVTGLAGVEPEVAFNQVGDLRAKLAEDGKLTGALGTKSRELKQAGPLLDRVRVDGARVDQRPDLVEPLWAHLGVEIELRTAEASWGLPPTGPPASRFARLVDENEALALLVGFGDALGRLAHTAQAPFAWNGQRTLAAVRAAFDALAVDELRAQVAGTVEPSRRALEAALGGGVPEVADALAALNAWNPDGYATASAAFDAVRAANALLAEVDAAHVEVAAGHAELATRLATSPDDPAWDTRLPLLVEAWHWSAWEARIRDLADPETERKLLAEVDRAEREERVALRGLAANLSWDRCLARVTDADRLHLNGYVKAMKRIGKGTGKYVRRYRAEARDHLAECQQAVPAWIMPLYRVADSVALDRPDQFDVVIIDEASQSGPEALLLAWLAPQLVVVGDDEQVSPEEVGYDRGEVQQLIDTWVADLPSRSLLQIGSSFFDLAKASGRSILLTEHFRCMPEIISFSNRECYGGRLKALRQYGTDRLPPLRHTHVPGAVVRGEVGALGNEAEAEALVEQIVACCADPAYDGRTMGVITLQGGVQERLIHDRLVTKLPIEEIDRRRLRVGSPESFQGDERDVVFLSMVAALESDAGPRRLVAQTREDARRRYNVAASRARDQAWLFHSVQLADLSPGDLRHHYLEYTSTPYADEPDVAADVPRAVRVPPFDSVFEQRVYLDLRDRGFRVRPQYQALGYYIDLVVEGGSSRLAVECDGDTRPGPDRADYDGSRQRDLERVGWTVWRLRASTYSRDPAAALAPLWELLEEHRIDPARPHALPPAITPSPSPHP